MPDEDSTVTKGPPSQKSRGLRRAAPTEKSPLEQLNALSQADVTAVLAPLPFYSVEQVVNLTGRSNPILNLVATQRAIQEVSRLANHGVASSDRVLALESALSVAERFGLQEGDVGIRAIASTLQQFYAALGKDDAKSDALIEKYKLNLPQPTIVESSEAYLGYMHTLIHYSAFDEMAETYANGCGLSAEDRGKARAEALKQLDQLGNLEHALDLAVHYHMYGEARSFAGRVYRARLDRNNPESALEIAEKHLGPAERKEAADALARQVTSIQSSLKQLETALRAAEQHGAESALIKDVASGIAGWLFYLKQDGGAAEIAQRYGLSENDISGIKKGVMTRLVGEQSYPEAISFAKKHGLGAEIETETARKCAEVCAHTESASAQTLKEGLSLAIEYKLDASLIRNLALKLMKVYINEGRTNLKDEGGFADAIDLATTHLTRYHIVQAADAAFQTYMLHGMFLDAYRVATKHKLGDQKILSAQLGLMGMGHNPKALVREITGGNSPNPTSESYLRRFVIALKLPEGAYEVAAKMLAQAREKGAAEKESDKTVAAAIIFLAAWKMRERRAQSEISLVSDVSEVTIRRMYRKLLSTCGWDITIN